MGEYMHIAILGTGFGAYHGELYKKMNTDIELTIWGRDKKKLEVLQKKLDCNITLDINDIWSNKNISLIDICLPSDIHKEYTVQALKNRKDVFLETPGVLKLEDAYEIIEAMRQYRKKVFVNMFLRCEPPYEYLYNTLKKKELGTLKHLNIYRRTPALWGSLGFSSICTNFMIHDIAFVTYLLGKPDQIIHQGIENSEGSMAIIDLFLDYKKTKVHVLGSSMEPMGYPFSVGYEAMFEKGVVKYFEDGYENSTEMGLFLYSGGKRQAIKYEEEEHCKKSLETIINNINNKHSNKMDFTEAMISLKIAFELEETLRV